MTTFLQDLRHTLRGLSRSPGFTASAVLTLALGIGANTAIFSIEKAVLLQPLGFQEPERVVALEERQKDGSASNTSFATYVDWRARNRSFEEIAAISFWTPKLSGAGRRDAEKLQGLRVTDGFLRLLGVRPALGRDFLPAEQQTGNHHVVILGHGLWKRRFGGDPGIVGKTIPLGDTPYLVAGVLPEGFESVFSADLSRPAEIWAPLGYNATQSWACRTCRHLRAIGRVKAGVTLAQARADMEALSGSLFGEHPTEYAAAGVLVTPFARRLTGDARPALYTLAAAVGLVLLIACANVATLLLSRGAGRRREIAVRTALGASRSRIARLFLTEAVVLALAGGALGLAAADWTLSSLTAAAPAIPRLLGARLDGWVLLFTVAVSVATGLFFGAVPAWRFSRVAPEPALREGAAGSPTGRSRRAGGLLVGLDVALALTLLFGAGLLGKSVSRLLQVDPGFEPRGLLTLELDVSGARYEDDAAVLHLYDQAVAGLQGLPGVLSAGVVSQLPLGGNLDSYGIHLEARRSANPQNDPEADRYAVSPDYLRAMKIPVRKGRGLLETDRAGSLPVVLINETLARRVWPGQDPLGERLNLGDPEKGAWRTVVGIVGDVRHGSLDAPRTNQIYLPLAQWEWADRSTVIVVRTAGPPADTAAAARAVLRAVAPDQPVTRLATMEQVIGASTAARRFSRDLLFAFAGLALLLAAIGIYGVVSGFVGRHTREIGIRMALGAQRTVILGLVARRMIRVALGGVGAGTLAALTLGRLLHGQLFDVAPGDPTVLLTGSVFLLLLVLVSSLLPARRATRIDPVAALRAE